MNVIIHYNLFGGIPDAHGEVKREMQALEYSDYFRFQSGSVIHYLPNASLWHANKLEPQAAIDDLNRVVNKINLGRIPSHQVKIERCIALPFGNIAAIPGQAHAS